MYNLVVLIVGLYIIQHVTPVPNPERSPRSLFSRSLVNLTPKRNYEAEEPNIEQQFIRDLRMIPHNEHGILKSYCSVHKAEKRIGNDLEFDYSEEICNEKKKNFTDWNGEDFTVECIQHVTKISFGLYTDGGEYRGPEFELMTGCAVKVSSS